MAEFVMQDMVRRIGAEDRYFIASAATSTEEIGNGVHYGTRERLRREGISCAGKRARQMTRADYHDYDLLIGMDNWNKRNMLRITGGDPDGKIRLLMDYTDRPREVADPWYTGDFEATYRDISEGCRGLLDALERGEH